MKPVEKKHIEDIFSLTPMQEGMLFHYLREPDKGIYFEQLCLVIPGAIDHKIFEQAWAVVVSTNEMLRTVFRWQKLKEPVQMVLKTHRLEPVYHDLSRLNSGEKQKRLEEIKTRDRQQGFDLRQVPFRVTLCKVEKDRYEMVVSHHHILYDGWSNGILLKEFFAAFHALSQGETLLPVHKTRFKEFVKYIRDRERHQKGEQEFWQGYLENVEMHTELSVKNRREQETGEAEELQTRISNALKAKLEAFARDGKVTLASVLYTAWGLLLQRYNDSDDVIFGSTVSGRPPGIKGIEDMVGLFINTLPLRVRTRADGRGETLGELAARIDNELQQRETYSSTPLVKINEYNTFDTLVVIENYPLELLNTPVLSYTNSAATHYDLTAAVTVGHDIEVIFSYPAALFEKSTVKGIARHFTRILEEMAANPGLALHRLELLSPAEKETVLFDFNRTPEQPLPGKTLHDLFEEVVEAMPDRIAVVAVLNNRSYRSYMTYKQLNRKSGRLASLLQAKGVTPGTVVAIMVEPSLEMAVGILGILKAGGAYLPIDPGYPEERIKYMLADSSVRVLLTDKDLFEEGEEKRIDNCQLSIVNCQLLMSLPETSFHHSSFIDHHCGNLACVIYTSGTTGRPRGVTVEHRGLVNYICWRLRAYHYWPGDVTLQLLSYSFDGWGAVFYSALLSGGALVLVPGTERLNIVFIRKILKQEAVTNLSLVPGMYEALVRGADDGELAGLRFVVLAGEKADPGLVVLSREKNPHLRHIIEYGPTEATVTAVANIDLRGSDTSVIGRSIANTQIYILDRYSHLVPVGVPGELCISGAGVARGYLNNPELTNQKFLEVQEPFFKKVPGRRRHYRTGDLARWHPDGNIEFLGRMDQQVKVRGYRIEPGEIEEQLRKHPHVGEAVVTARAGVLCAYIVSPSHYSTELKEFLSQTLPDYMIPTYFVSIEKIPLTLSGKVDWRALPEPGAAVLAGGYAAPQNKTEEKLLEIWRDVLRVSGSIGIDDNFFELGGHSLKAAALTAGIHKELDLEVSLEALFKRPTVRQLAAHIREIRHLQGYSSIEPVEQKESYPLSPAQERLYMLQQRDDTGTAYNMPTVLQLEGAVDRDKLETVFKTLIKRHESLRTSFKPIGGEAVQEIHQEVDFEIENFSLISRFIRPFDLSQAPLMRVGLLEVEEGAHILIIDVHHIIADGVSMGILIREMTALYRGEVLPGLRFRYKDYSEWRVQWEEKERETLERQEAYWQDVFGGELPVIDLPVDYKRPAIQSFAGDTVTFELPGQEITALQSLASAKGSTLYMVILAAYTVFLAKVCRQEDIVVGVPTAGRGFAGLEGIVGMFVNTLALRNAPSGEKTVNQFLPEVTGTTLAAFANQDFQYNRLVESIRNTGTNTDLSRNPLFDTMLVQQEVDITGYEIPGLQIKPYPYESNTSKFDLLLHFMKEGNKVWFKFEYSTRLFKKTTIERFTGYFRQIVKGLLQDGEQRLWEIEVLPEREKQQLLMEFNDTRTDYPFDKTIHLLFREQAARAGDRIALQYSFYRTDRTYRTYKKLDEESDQLACILRSKGVKPGTIAAMVVERSMEMIVGILAVLKAGGAYLPIDPEYPEERINYMLQESGAEVLLTDLPEGHRSFNCQLSIVNYQLLMSAPHTTLHHSSFVETPNHSDLAYVIYTSGTTGRPKGVLIEHRNVVRLLFNDKFQFDFSEKDTWTLFHSYCFDFSVWEMYGALLYGGELVIIPRRVARDMRRYLEVLKTAGVTVLNQTPSAFYLLAEEELKSPNKGLHLRYVIFGGEALWPGRLKEWYEKYPETRLINMFGITETTVHVTYKEIGAEEISLNKSNIGKPIPTLTTYVMDNHLQLAPIGTPGELCVGGAGVGRGYLNRPELTNSKFQRGWHPLSFSASQLLSFSLYRSGDLGRLSPGGELEYLGRIDHQVKIRGFRIESGEIESRLAEHESIKEAVVVTRTDKAGDNYLCAYIVFQSPHSSQSADLRRYLAKTLPDYMIPAYFVELAEIPLTANGKVDRRRLPEPGAAAGDEPGYEPPRDETQEQMAETWKQVLGVERIGIRDGFFNTGGDSIKAVRLIGLINDRLNTNFKIKDLYAHQTIEELAALAARSRKGYSGEELNRVEQEIRDLEQRVMKEGNLNEADIEDIYPMSDIEKGLVFYYLKNTDAAVYHDQFIYPLKYRVFDMDLFKKALGLLVEKHHILRTGFNIEGFEEPVQIVYRNVLFDVPHFDISHLEKKEQEEYIKKYLAEDKQHLFDAAVPPLFRMSVFIPDEENVYIVLVIHHAILDGWSAASLMTELHNTYLKLKTDPHLVPERLKSSYRDVIVEELLEKRSTRNRDFWLRELEGYKRLEFPRILKADGKFTGMRTHDYRMAAGLLEDLKKVAGSYGTHLKDICFAAYIYVMAMLCNESDIVVGCVSHNRPQKQDGDKVLGCFLNTVPIRIVIPGSMDWEGYLAVIAGRMLEIRKHERFSLFEIARVIGEKSQEKNPIFDTLFNFVDFHVYFDADPGTGQHRSMDAVPFSLEGNQDTNTLFDFEISITFGEFILCPKYNHLAISDEMVRRSCVYFERIIKKFIHEPRSIARKDDILPEEEKQNLLEEFNRTAAAYGSDRTMHELFEEQVEKTPDSPAAAGDNGHVSYKELNKKANRLAWALQEKGVKTESLVGVVIDRSIDMIIAVMAILKAGGAYVPLEIYLPDSRIKRLLESLNVKYLVTNDLQMPKMAKIVQELPELQDIFCLPEGKIKSFDQTFSKVWPPAGPPEAYSTGNVSSLTGPGDIAYIIFTSGSTGTPKGVVVRHRPVINLIEWVNRTFEVGPGDKMIFVSSLGFDLSVYDIFGILAGGACTRVVSADDLKEPQQLLDIILQEGITFWDSAPAALQQLVPFLPEVKHSPGKSRLRLVFLSGDWIPVTLPDRLKEAFEGVKVIGLGGATEAAIWSNYYPIGEVDPAWVSIPYGRPIQNAAYYILDPQMNVCPLMVPGDLYIGGQCLAAGYINDVELTAAKFPPNPFVPGGTIYKTGDIARWFPDGNMEFLGRKDQQVKIRGFRIELGEIESQLRHHDDIKEAVVTAVGERVSDRFLCAYIVADKELTAPALAEYLAAELPDYMIPKYFIPLEKIPLTPNGKVNRKALPEPEGPAGGARYAAPQDEIEEKLIEIWSEVLALPASQADEAIGIDADFFELGGHSLNAAVVISRIHKLLNVKVPLAELFHKPTIRQLAGVIRVSAEDKFASLEPVEEKEYYPLSSAQKRLYILQRMDPGNTVYNIPHVVELQGSIDKDKLQRVFREIIRRHESFRTSFNTIDGEPVQRIHKDVEFSVEQGAGSVERGAWSREQGAWDRDSLHAPCSMLHASSVRPFDLSQAPLLRVGLMEMEKDDHILVLDMHHIISDGTSMGILIAELMELYKGGELPLQKVRYRDYSFWLESPQVSRVLKGQEVSWKQQFAGDIPVLDLPYDYPRPELQRFEGNTAAFELDKEVSAQLNRLALQQGATLYMVLLAVFNVFLFKLSGREDIVVGTPVEGRRHADLERMIGMFVNTLALRNEPAGEKTFNEFLQELKERSLKAFENQDYPFEELVEQLEVPRDLSRNPLFDVMLVLQNMETPEIRIPGLTLAPYRFESSRSKFDLTLTVIERQGKLDLLFEYCTLLFEKETMLRFTRYFKKVVFSVIQEPGKPIAGLEIMGEEERRQILYDFNDTAADYPRDKTVHGLFEEQTARTPDAAAIVMSYRTYRTYMTYKKLNRESGRLAFLLVERGVAPGDIVGVMVERSVEMMIGIYGIIKAGGAYLPIDPGYPEERINYMLKDSGAKVLLKNTINCQLSIVNCQLLMSTGVPGTANLLYVIYTSGTTGKPKGVMIEHHSLVNRLNWMQKQYPLDENDTILHKTPFTFDVSVWEIFWWGMIGARVCLLAPEGERDPQQIKDAVYRHRVTVMHFVPSMLRAFLEYIEQSGDVKRLNSLKQVIASGEALPASLVKRFNELLYNNGTRLANLYGPTEAAIDVSFYDCPAGEDIRRIPIGRPIDNIRLYILDKQLNIQPVGVVGELCIAGVGLARGYLNRPELTAERFNRSYRSYRTYIFYRTGDLARWLRSGNIEFLGRIDHQVKVRGFRIELEEIEKQLERHASVKETVVLAEPSGKGDNILCAYIVTGSHSELDVTGLKDYLGQQLPGYMVPSVFKQVERIPLTANGKVDRKALHATGSRLGAGMRSLFVPPATPTETRIANIWQEVLKWNGKGEIGIHDNFFDIGGTSMDVIRVNAKLTKELGKEIPIIAMYKYTTIRSLSQFIEQGKTDETGERDLHYESEREIKVQRGRSDKNKIREMRRRGR